MPTDQDASKGSLPYAQRPLNPKEQEMWIRVWCSVANANDCKTPDLPTTWADRAIRALRLRVEGDVG